MEFSKKTATPFVVAGVLVILMLGSNVLATFIDQLQALGNNLVANGPIEDTLLSMPIFLEVLLGALFYPVNYLLIALGCFTKGKLMKLTGIGFILNALLTLAINLLHLFYSIPYVEQMADYYEKGYSIATHDRVVCIWITIILEMLIRSAISLGMIGLAVNCFMKLKNSVLRMVAVIILGLAEISLALLHICQGFMKSASVISPASEPAVSGLLLLIVAILVFIVVPTIQKKEDMCEERLDYNNQDGKEEKVDMEREF